MPDATSMPQGDHLDEDALLRAVVEGTATETGERFFAALVRARADILGTHGAWVTEYAEERRRLRALAFWLGGRFVPDFEYAIAGTPCEVVIEQRRAVHYPDNVLALFPDDRDLADAGAVSFMGVPLEDTDGRIRAPRRARYPRQAKGAPCASRLSTCPLLAIWRRRR